MGRGGQRREGVRTSSSDWACLGSNAGRVSNENGHWDDPCNDTAGPEWKTSKMTAELGLWKIKTKIKLLKKQKESAPSLPPRGLFVGQCMGYPVLSLRH